MKSGKEIKINSSNKNFKIKCGAVSDYKAPVSVYLKITSWLRVTNKVVNLNSLLREYRLRLRSYLKSSELVLNHFDYNTIIDIDISQSRVKMDKPTFFSLEFNFYQKNSNNLLPLVQPKRVEMVNLKPVIEKITEDILNMELFTEHPNFKYQYKKQEIE